MEDLTASVTISYEEVQALFSIVMAGRRHVQDCPESYGTLHQSMKDQGKVAFGVTHRIIRALCDEYEKDTEKWENVVDGAYLTDSYVLYPGMTF